MSDRPCTCHPDDNPPVPCPKKYALSECKVAAPAPDPYFLGLAQTLLAALKRLSFAAQTACGTAGRDDELVAAIAQAENAIKEAHGRAAAPAPEWQPVPPRACIKPTHEAADAFWKYWRENGETHKHGYYESTWGAINAALACGWTAPAAPAPEPVAWIEHHKAGDNLLWDEPGGKKTALYAHPAPVAAPAPETVAWMIVEPGCEYGPTFSTENAAWSALTKAPPGSELVELIRRKA